MRVRDLVIIISFVAVIALFLGSRKTPPAEEIDNGFQEQEQKLNQARPKANQSQDILSHREAIAGSIVAPSDNKDFRIKRLTASILADNVADEEKAAIAGYVVDTIDVSNALVDPKWGTFQIDGVGLEAYTEQQLEDQFGKHEFISSASKFGEPIFWQLSDGRFLVATALSGLPKFKVTSVTGRQLHLGTRLLLRTGEAEQTAMSFLGPELLDGRRVNDERFVQVGVQIENNLIKTITLTEYRVDPETNKTI